jgi:hypothetical protein
MFKNKLLDKLKENDGIFSPSDDIYGDVERAVNTLTDQDCDWSYRAEALIELLNAIELVNDEDRPALSELIQFSAYRRTKHFDAAFKEYVQSLTAAQEGGQKAASE